MSCEPRGSRAAVLQPASLPAQLAPTDAATAPPGHPAAAPSPGSAPSWHGFRVGCSEAPRRACPAPSRAVWASRCGPSTTARAIGIRTAQWGLAGPWGPEFEAREEREAPPPAGSCVPRVALSSVQRQQLCTAAAFPPRPRRGSRAPTFLLDSFHQLHQQRRRDLRGTELLLQVGERRPWGGGRERGGVRPSSARSRARDGHNQRCSQQWRP